MRDTGRVVAAAPTGGSRKESASHGGGPRPLPNLPLLSACSAGRNSRPTQAIRPVSGGIPVSLQHIEPGAADPIGTRIRPRTHRCRPRPPLVRLPLRGPLHCSANSALTPPSPAPLHRRDASGVTCQGMEGEATGHRHRTRTAGYKPAINEQAQRKAKNSPLHLAQGHIRPKAAPRFLHRTASIRHRRSILFLLRLVMCDHLLLDVGGDRVVVAQLHGVGALPSRDALQLALVVGHFR